MTPWRKRTTMSHSTAMHQCPRFRTAVLRVLATILLTATATTEAHAQQDANGLTVRDVCVYEISAYGQQVNARSLYRSTLPATIISQRPAAPRDEANAPMPIGLITFEGTPTDDIDVMLEFTSGRFVAHWPPGNHRSQRLLWAGLNLNEDSTDAPRISPGHWLTRLFEAPRLYAHAESRSSRGLLYDAEIQFNPQLKLTNVEGEYRLENTGPFAVTDFAFYLPAEEGKAWKVFGADAAPGVGKPDNKADAEVKPDPESVFESNAQAEGSPPEESKPDAETKPAAEPEGETKPTPKPAAIEEEERLAPPAVVAQADAVAEAAAEDASKVEAANAAAKAAAEGAGDATPAAEGDADKQNQKFTALAAVEAEPVAADAALAPWRETLSNAGLGEHEVEHVMSILTQCALRPDSAVAIYRLDAQTLETLLPLEVTPLPETVIRVGLVVLLDCDPQLETSITELITQLGDPAWKKRVAAQAKLAEMSQAAIPKLTEAVNNPDVEIAYRAEQLLEELQSQQGR